LKLPSLATHEDNSSLAFKQNRKSAKSIDAIINGWAVRIAKFIPIDEYKKRRMKNTLKAAGMNQTPEEFIAVAVIKSGLIVLGVIPSLYYFPYLLQFCYSLQS